ncbi:MAG TPA: hypothetical protein VF659_01730 [Pyrinomonadaceae bacterium]
MGVTDDLSPFFNLDEHAVEAALKTPEGVAVRTIRVILSVPVGEVQVGAAEVTHLQPTFQCATADLEGVRKGYQAVIAGTTYRVVRRENDGTGLSTAWLTKQ